jgi:hypothetical protein
MTEQNIPPTDEQQDVTGIPETDDETEFQDDPDLAPSAVEEGTLETPTSSDVGKQTLTKKDLGYDVTKEGVPPDEEAMVTPQHPDDPSADEETERNPGMAGSESQAE